MDEHTLARYLEPGRPLSRAKAHICRDEAAREAIAAQIISDNTMETMIVAPVLERVACWKISIKGNKVGVVSALSMSPMQKRMAMSMPKPRAPLMPMLQIRLCGTTRVASRISSLMCTAPSAPMKANTVVIKPTKKDMPLLYPPMVRYCSKTSSGVP